MGWTFQHHTGTVEQFVQKQFNRDPSWGTVVDWSKVGNVLYLAIKLGPNCDSKLQGKTMAYVCLLAKSKDYCNFGWKDMTESMGPNETKCPKRIIKQLSPLNELFDPRFSSYGYAMEWRERCMNRKSVKQVKEGEVIKLPSPIKFQNGQAYDTFRKLRTRRWMAMLVNPDGELKPVCVVRMPTPSVYYPVPTTSSPLNTTT